MHMIKRNSGKKLPLWYCTIKRKEKLGLQKGKKIRRGEKGRDERRRGEKRWGDKRRDTGGQEKERIEDNRGEDKRCEKRWETRREEGKGERTEEGRGERREDRERRGEDGGQDERGRERRGEGKRRGDRGEEIRREEMKRLREVLSSQQTCTFWFRITPYLSVKFMPSGGSLRLSFSFISCFERYCPSIFSWCSVSSSRRISHSWMKVSFRGNEPRVNFKMRQTQFWWNLKNEWGCLEKSTIWSPGVVLP